MINIQVTIVGEGLENVYSFEVDIKKEFWEPGKELQATRPISEEAKRTLASFSDDLAEFVSVASG